MFCSFDYEYENVFTEDSEQGATLDDRRIRKYRTKTIKCGEVLEVETYPIWNIDQKRDIEAAKANATRQAQQNLNEKNAKKQLERLLNLNFVNKKDIYATFTYADETAPKTEAEAKKGLQNYFRRLKTYIQNVGLPPLKYVAVTEWAKSSKTGELKPHHHIIMNVRDRNMLEKLWGNGRTQARLLQADDCGGLQGLAKYLTKDPKGSKRYSASRNLKNPKNKPHTTKSDNKISKRRAAAIAKDPSGAKEYFERLYRGYCFKGMEVKYSEYISGAYLYVRMLKL